MRFLSIVQLSLRKLLEKSNCFTQSIQQADKFESIRTRKFFRNRYYVFDYYKNAYATY